MPNALRELSIDLTDAQGFGRRLRFWIALLLALFFVNGALTFFNNRNAVVDANNVSHTYTVLNEIDALWETLLTAESSQRGYLITLDEAFLSPLDSAESNCKARLDELTRITGDNPIQRDRIPKLRESVLERVRELKYVKDLRVASGTESVTARLPVGRALMSEIDSITTAMRAEEARLLGIRVASSNHTYEIGSLSAILEAIVGVVVLFLFSRLLRRHLHARVKATELLFVERERFQTTLSSIGDGVITTDIAGRVQFLNAVASELTGHSTESARGKGLEEVFVIVNEDTRKPVDNPAMRALREGCVVGLANHTVLIAKDGTERAIDDSAAPIRKEDGSISGAVLVFRDVSTRRAEERAQTESSRVMQLRIAIGDLLTSDLELDAGLIGCTDAFVRLVGAEFARIWLIDEQGTRLQLRATSGGDVALSGEDKIIQIGKSRFGEIAATRTPYWTNDVAAEAEFANREWSSGDLVQSIAGYPLVIEDRLLGVLGVFSNRPISQVLFDELELIADVIAQFIERKRVDENRLRLAALIENSSDAINIFDEHGKLMFVNRAASRLFARKAEESEKASMPAGIRDLLLEEDHPRFDSELLPAVLRDGHSQFEMRMRLAPSCGEGKGADVGSMGSDPAAPKEAAPAHVWMNCHAFAVLDSKGRRTGIGMVCRDVTQRRTTEQFLTESQEQYRLLAAQFHAANLKLQEEMAERALANEALERRSSQLQSITEIATRLNVVHDIPSVMNMITEGARRIVATRAGISIVSRGDRTDDRLVVASFSEDLASYRGRGEDFVNRRIHEAVYATKRVIRVSRDEIANESRWQTGSDAPDRNVPLADVIAAPIVGYDGTVLGALHLIDKTTGPFTSEDEAIVVQLALMGSVAIENARLYAELVDADRRKDEFLATLAHELRNPLAPIRNGLQILSITKNDTDAQITVRQMMERQVSMMVRLVDDLLDVSRITRGKIHLQVERLDLARAIRDAVETSRPLIDAAHHELIVEMPARPIYVMADRVRLAQIVANLLNNAAKFTPDGGRIEVRIEGRGKEVAIRVRDNGVGIPREMLPRIFDLFTQVDRTLRLTRSGVGIGLALVKRLVELHGGTVEAHSDGPDQGCELVVRLATATETTDEASRMPAIPAPAPAGRTHRVLVVDDHRDSAESLGILLRLMGNTVVTCGSGEEALRIATEFRPEIFFLDIGLPDMNGYELAGRLKSIPGFENAYFVAQTGWGQETDRRRSNESGFQAHLVKPIDIDLLKELLQGL